MESFIELQITGRAKAEEAMRQERAQLLPPRERVVPYSVSFYRGRHWHRYIYHYLHHDLAGWWQSPMSRGWRVREVVGLPESIMVARLKTHPLCLTLKGVQRPHLPQVQKFFLQDLFQLYGLSREGLLYIQRGERISLTHDGFRDRLLLKEIGQNFALTMDLSFEVLDAP